MVTPFFIEKIISLKPSISFKFLDIESPSRVRPITPPVYFPSSVYKPQPQTKPSFTPINKYHRENPMCRAYRQYETLDGTDYYLCQHGQRIA